jgi:hypothetical protein
MLGGGPGGFARRPPAEVAAAEEVVGVRVSFAVEVTG